MPARRRLAASAAAAVVGLLVVVAIASRHGAVGEGGGSANARAPSDVVDVLYTFGLPALLLLMAATLWTMRPSARFRHGREPQSSLWPGLLAAGLVCAAFALVAIRGLDVRGAEPTETPQAVGPPRVEPAQTVAGEEDARAPQFRWTPFLVVAAIGAVAIAGLGMRRLTRPAPEATSEDELVAELLATVDDALLDLQDEPNARRAVIAAYARMERALAAHGLPRTPSEAPLEYLVRIAPGLGDSRRLVFELTHLYEQARFSADVVDRGMKRDAIETLAALREKLLEAA